jgi:hypothetical protein
VQAGLVHASDKYGDYGYVGFYLLHVHTHHLEHFCFSCRTLGMKLEVWLYNRLLNRPTITIVSPVVTDLLTEPSDTDWSNNEGLGEDENHRVKKTLLFRGSCELQPIAYYASADFADVVGEWWFNHSSFLDQAFVGMTDEQLVAARAIGYKDEHFGSRLLTNAHDFSAVILSYWTTRKLCIGIKAADSSRHSNIYRA